MNEARSGFNCLPVTRMLASAVISTAQTEINRLLKIKNSKVRRITLLLANDKLIRSYGVALVPTAVNCHKTDYYGIIFQVAFVKKQPW